MKSTVDELQRGRILVLADHYLPGYRAGGPIKSLRNLVATLGEEYEIRIVTRDRDLRSPTPYTGTARRQWVEMGGAKVFYLPPGLRGMVRLLGLLRRTPHGLLYLQSLFSWPFTLWPLLLRRLGLIADVPILLAPRGELSPGALRLKPRKKRMFLRIARIMGLYDDVVWQASSEEEKSHLRTELGVEEIHIGPNIPVNGDTGKREPKETNSLRILFLSRISRKKNLDFALRIVGSLDVPSRMTIVGPVEDETYWRECRAAVDSLPDRVTVEFVGPIPPDRIDQAYLTHDVLFLPTLGENYGWVIAEALSAGCPVLISDQTPWRDLERHGVGWDLPLSAPPRFVEALRTVYGMTDDQHRQMSYQASQWACAAVGGRVAIAEQRAIFDRILRSVERP